VTALLDDSITVGFEGSSLGRVLVDCGPTVPDGQGAELPEYPQPLEYPCNCTRCRNVADDRETYHDGEVTWWRCIFCGRHFELEDTEPVLADECPYVAEDSQACVRCTEGWKQSCRAA